jgi:hypothetical protein
MFNQKCPANPIFKKVPRGGRRIARRAQRTVCTEREF